MNIYDRERVEILRQKAISPIISYQEFYLYFYRRYAQNQNLDKPELRYADAYAYAFENITISIDDGELIVGKPNHLLNENEQVEWHILSQTIAAETTTFAGQDSHMAIDYELLLNSGIDGVISSIDTKLNSLSSNDTEKHLFYDVCKSCLQTVVTFSNRYASMAEKLSSNCTDPKRSTELLQISSICARVPEFPAASFYEAVQSIHFISFCLSFDPMRYFSHLMFQLGHPDRYLWSFYKKDLESGDITKHDAQILLDCLGIQINNRVPSGLSSGYMVGGIDENGMVVSNELTEMCMRVIEHIHLVYPAVGLCYTKETPNEDLKLACDILKQGYSHPAIFNDDIISSGLQEYGLPEKDSHNYIQSSCVEITPVASSNVWVASPYTNLAQKLLDILNTEYQSMDELLTAYFEHIGESIENNFIEQNLSRKLRSEKCICPLLSCFVNDCLENGIDIERGGARYNWIMPSFVGMANLVDSLYVIQKLIFEQHQYTFSQLKVMLDCDFASFEPQRLQMLNSVEKYGNNIDEVDSYVKKIGEWIVNECKKYTPVFTNGLLIPSVFCWIMHEVFGQQTGATPDGRKGGFPLGDGSGPAQGRELNGPTASILSSTKWSHKAFIGGVAVNMKFSKTVFSEDSSNKMIGLVKTYMELGGFEIQINVTDRETLLKAQKNPEQYQDLVVRIGGYSDYFIKLSAAMQAEVLLRTEHVL